MISLVTGLGGTSVNFFSISIRCIAKQKFQPIFINRYLSNEKNICADDSRVKITILSMENSFFLTNLSLAVCMGNSSLRLSEDLRYI